MISPSNPPYGYSASSQTPPPPPAPERRMGCFPKAAIGAGVFFALLLIIGIVGLAASSENDDGGGTETDSGTPTATANGDGGQDIYAIGDTANTGGLDITVHQIQDPHQPSNSLVSAQPGHRLVAVEAELNNPTDEVVTWSMLAGAELTDSQGRPWQPTITGDSLPLLDGDVPAAGNRRGWILFEVADDANGLTVRIKGNLTATGSLFDLGV